MKIDDFGPWWIFACQWQDIWTWGPCFILSSLIYEAIFTWDLGTNSSVMPIHTLHSCHHNGLVFYKYGHCQIQTTCPNGVLVWPMWFNLYMASHLPPLNLPFIMATNTCAWYTVCMLWLHIWCHMSNISQSTFTTHQVIPVLLSSILQGHPWWIYFTIITFTRLPCNIVEFARADWVVWTIARLLGRYQRMLHQHDQAPVGQYAMGIYIHIRLLNWGESILCVGLDNPKFGYRETRNNNSLE